MGEYNLNTNNTFIIVDGHMCIEVEPEIYKVDDNDRYVINPVLWEKDERNKNLYIIAEVKEAFDTNAVVRFVCKAKYDDVQKFMNKAHEEYSGNLLITTSVYTRDTPAGADLALTFISGGDPDVI